MELHAIYMAWKWEGGGKQLIEILILNFPTYFSFFPFI